MARLIFLGTAGTRYCMLSQRRASGGMWLCSDEVNICIDPGPGALVRAWECGLVNPFDLNAVVLSHRHLDHSNDVNVMVEAMTRGNRARRGAVILPRDAVESHEPVVFDYLKGSVEHFWLWDEAPCFRVGDVVLRPNRLVHHGVDCWGFRAEIDGYEPVYFLSDTGFFSGMLGPIEGCHTVVASVTLLEANDRIQHLSVDEVPLIVRGTGVRRFVMTHLGRSVLDDDPERIARELSSDSCEVLAATDGMVLELIKA